MENDDTTNLADVDDEIINDAEVDDTDSDDDFDTDDETDDGEPEDDSEEVDHEGTKYRVPKALKDSFLRQADYTRKTQEVADERRALATRAGEMAQQAEVLQATSEQRMNLKLINQQIDQLSNTNWNQFDTSNPEVAAWVSQQSIEWQQLRDVKQLLEANISGAEKDFLANSERQSANAIGQAGSILAREIEGWSPQLVNSLVAYAHSELGISEQELKESLSNYDGTPDTRTFKVLARLHKAETELAALKSKTKNANQNAKLTAVQPAKSVGGKTSSYRAGLDDSLPADEWLRRRNAQLAKARSR